MTSSSSNGFVVKDAAVASPIAQDHQAIGCRSRGSALDEVALEGCAGPVTARQTPRLRRATTALPAIAIASRPTMLQVTAAGIRAGSPALGSPASDAALAVESPGDSTSGSVASGSSLALESPGDSSSSVPSSDPLSDPPLARESPGDSEASGDPEGLDGVPDGEACGEDPDPPDEPEPLPPEVPPPAPEGLDDGLVDEPEPPEPPEPPLPPDGEAVGEDGDELGEELGDDVGDGVGEAVGLDERVTGGATDGGTLPPAGRSCCHDQPTEPPAGTVRLPAP
jgi:hypothetical protein